MNSKTTCSPLQTTVAAGLLFCSAAVVSANTTVTLHVDMSNAPFDPATQSVAARGTFNGWGALALTNNPSGANPYVWSGTASLTNTDVLQYKYTVEPGANYETVFMTGAHDRLALIPKDGSSLDLPKVYFGDSPAQPTTVSVRFQVDLAQQINVGAFNPASSTVYVRGIFNGWGGSENLMTNDPSILTTNNYGLVSSNVYTTSYEITGSPGQTMDFKYYIDPGAIWESPGPLVGDPKDNNNRFFNLAETSPQALAPVYFSEAAYAPVATNEVTFQVDMTAQVLNGNFDPASGTVEVRGNFNSWATGANFCTNNPSSANTNLYTAVIKIVDGVNASEQYKFAATVPVNSGWETRANRAFNLANTNSQALPVVFFDDISPSDLLSADTLVTFRVDMTGAKTTGGNAFNPAAQSVVLNGPPAGTFQTWEATMLSQLSNNPAGSGIYSVEVLIPKYSPVRQTYKYGINDGSTAIDNEAASGNNHVRYIRGTGTYVMPLDTFGSMVSEPAFGNLLSGLSAAGDHVLLSWLGGPGVHLQSRTSLNNGSWLDHPETDGLSSTNWPISGESFFFRLSKQ